MAVPGTGGYSYICVRDQPQTAMNRVLPAILLGLLLAPAALAAEDPALASLRVAAERGEADAQYELAILYEFGFDLPDHRVAALAWYLRAADQGNVAAARRRDLLMGQLSTAEVERASREARALARTAQRD